MKLLYLAYGLLFMTIVATPDISASSCRPVLPVLVDVTQKNEEERKMTQAFQKKLQEAERVNRNLKRIQDMRQVDFDRGKVMYQDYREVLKNTKQPLDERINCCKALLQEFSLVRESFAEEIAELKKDPDYLAGQFVAVGGGSRGNHEQKKDTSKNYYRIGSLYRFSVDKLQTFSYCKHYACLIKALLTRLQNAAAQKQKSVHSPSPFC